MALAISRLYRDSRRGSGGAHLIARRIHAMRKIQIFLASGIAALLAGCASPPRNIAVTRLPLSEPLAPPVEPLDFTYTSSHTLICRDVSLSLRAPRNTELQMRLVSIGGDATATIRLDSGQELSAKPGECFSCGQFGTSGLQLVSASRETGVAVFRRTACESRSTNRIGNSQIKNRTHHESDTDTRSR